MRSWRSWWPGSWAWRRPWHSEWASPQTPWTFPLWLARYIACLCSRSLNHFLCCEKPIAVSKRKVHNISALAGKVQYVFTQSLASYVVRHILVFLSQKKNIPQKHNSSVRLMELLPPSFVLWKCIVNGTSCWHKVTVQCWCSRSPPVFKLRPRGTTKRPVAMAPGSPRTGGSWEVRSALWVTPPLPVCLVFYWQWASESGVSAHEPALCHWRYTMFCVRVLSEKKWEDEAIVHCIQWPIGMASLKL